MILTQKAKVKWNFTNKSHYESLGYKYTKRYDEFEIPVNHLAPNSALKVSVECDVCNSIIVEQYSHYLKQLKKYEKDYCKKCERQMLAALRNDNTVKHRRDSGYWKNKENRISEFVRYLKEYKTVDSISTNDVNLYYAIKKYEPSIQDLAISLGYDWGVISNISPKNYFDDFEKVREKISEFISENNRFPSQKELIKKYRIQIRHVQIHGGIDEIKRKMDYSSHDDLVDSNGYYNKSLLEYQTAEFLIRHGISYKRETLPFPGRQIKCDFEIKTVDGVSVFVEVWGYSRNDIGAMAQSYNKKRQEKLNLYKSNDFNLIELEYDIMNRISYEKLNEYLSNKFKDIIKSKTIEHDYKYLAHPHSLSDQELADLLLSGTSSKNTLPTYAVGKEKDLDKFIREAVRRYGTYQKFADECGLSLTLNRHEWNDNTVNEFMLSLVQKGLPITRKNIEKHNAGGLFIFIRKTERNLLADRKLDFYEKCIGDINIIPSYDLSFLKKIADSKDDRRINKINPVDSKRAKSILNKYQSKIKHNVV